MSFLHVLTRCYRRPALLCDNLRSLAALDSTDWEQTLLVDTVGRGIGWSYGNMAAFAPHLRGDYVWILDDDDLCIRPTLVDELKAIAAEHGPEVVMVRMDHGERGVLPDGPFWQGPPVHGHIGCSAVIVQRAIWQRYAGAFGQHYAGDFDFIQALFDADYDFYWHDVVASRCQQIGYGKPQ